MKINGVYGSEPLAYKEVNQNSVIQETGLQNHRFVKVDSSNVIDDASLPTYKERLNEKQEKVIDTNVSEGNMKETMDHIGPQELLELSKDNTEVENLSEDKIEENLERIKKERALKEEGLEKVKGTLKEKEEAIKSVGTGNVKDSIIQLLETNNLPITDENIAKILDAYNQASAVVQLSDSGISYLIKNNLTLTSSNIYKAAYSSQGDKLVNIPEGMLESLKDKITQVVDKTMGVEKEEGIAISKWLLEHQLPVTMDSIWAYKDITTVKENFNTVDTLSVLVDGFSNGNQVGGLYLGTGTESRIESIQKEASKITLDGISYTIHKHGMDDISLYELVKGQNEFEKSNSMASTSSNGSMFTSLNDSDEFDIESVKVLRQLEELRLKLTVEAGSSLMKKGIHIETDSLQKVVDELKKIEDSYYNNLLKQGNVPVDEATVELLKQSLNNVDTLKKTPNYVLGSIVKHQQKRTMEQFVLEGEKLQKDLSKVSKSYETLMTSPSREYGDSIAKAFQNVDDILEDLNLAKTSENQKAVRILGYNTMDITKENIDEIKLLEKDMAYMLKELKPSTTVELIRRGINPSDMPISQLNSYIDEINQEIGVSEDEKYSKFLWKLEKEQGISKEEKESYIGIYRLLHNVEKTDGAAIGYLAKAEKEITLNNLLEAVRTRKLGHIEKQIDDTFGAGESANTLRNSITDQVNTAFDPSYQLHLVRESKDMMIEKDLGNMEGFSETSDVTLEHLHKELSQLEPSNSVEVEYYQEKKEEYTRLLHNYKETSGVLQEIDIETTINNIGHITDFISSDHTIFHKLSKSFRDKVEAMDEEGIESDNTTFDENMLNSMEEVESKILSSFENKKELQKVYDDLETASMNVLERTMENSNLSLHELNSTRAIAKGFHFLNTLSSKERYQVPLVVGDEVSTVNVTLVHNKENSGKIDMTVESKELGKLGVHLSVKESKVSGMIQVESKRVEEVVKQSMVEITSSLEDLELEVSNLSVVANHKGVKYAPSYNQVVGKEEGVNKDETPSTNHLYQVSKTILIGLKQIEMNIN